LGPGKGRVFPVNVVGWYMVWGFFVCLFAVLEFELRASKLARQALYHLGHSTFFVLGISKIVSHELFPRAGSELQSS
jgi:hypothetical protein